MFIGYYVYEVVHCWVKALVPWANLPELLHAEIKKLRSQLGLEHVIQAYVIRCFQVVKFKPKWHDFSIKMRTGLDKLDVQVFYWFTSGRLCELNLLLYYLLLLFFQLIYEVMCQLQNNCHKGASYWLIHHIFELNLLAYQINCCTRLAQ